MWGEYKFVDLGFVESVQCKISLFCILCMIGCYDCLWLWVDHMLPASQQLVSELEQHSLKRDVLKSLIS